MSHRRHAGRALASIVLLAVAAVASAGPAGAATHAIVDFKIQERQQPAGRPDGRRRRQRLVRQRRQQQARPHQQDGRGDRLATDPGGRRTTRSASRPAPTARCGSPSRPPTRSAASPRGEVQLVPRSADRQLEPARHHRRARRLPLLRRERQSTVNKIDPATKAVTLVATLPAGTGPTRIAAGADGNLWVTETCEERGRPGHPRRRHVHPCRHLPARQHPSRITSGPDGNIWVAEPGINHIAQITTAATPVLTQTSRSPGKPTGITSGPDGNLYVTEQSSNNIARVTHRRRGDVVRRSRPRARPRAAS